MNTVNFLRLNNEEKCLRVLARKYGCGIKSDAKETYIGKAFLSESGVFDALESGVVDFVNHRVFDNEAIETVFLYDPEAKTQKAIDNFYLDLVFDFVDDIDNFKMYIDNGDRVYILDSDDLGFCDCCEEEE